MNSEPRNGISAKLAKNVQAATHNTMPRLRIVKNSHFGCTRFVSLTYPATNSASSIGFGLGIHVRRYSGRKVQRNTLSYLACSQSIIAACLSRVHLIGFTRLMNDGPSCQTAESIGSRVKETNSETSTATVTAIPN